MKTKDIKSMQTADIQAKVASVRMELVKLNGTVATGSAPKNSGQIRQNKRDIARLLTELRARSSQ
jgi:large subunit ribosomal protein L29